MSKSKFLFRLVWSSSLGAFLVGCVTSYLLLSGSAQPHHWLITPFWIGLTLCFGLLCILALREEFGTRKRYRANTAGSPKWEAGHCAGCVLYAPDDRCICDEILAEAESRPTT